jgi:hypothetical protein
MHFFEFFFKKLVNVEYIWFNTEVSSQHPVLKFLNNLWGPQPSRTMVVVPARHATQPGGIGSLESILGLLKCLKIRAGWRCH